MILDLVTNRHLYAPLGPAIARALDYLERTDLAALAAGRHELDGDRLYLVASEYLTKPAAEGRWEVHRRYVDVHVVVRGTERVGYAPAQRLDVTSHEEERDIAWLAGSGEFLTVQPGDFMVLWPGEAHMPGMAVDAPGPVKKIVVKIAVDPATATPRHPGGD
jgi:YhcH/YjgK/YiaL family protein